MGWFCHCDLTFIKKRFFGILQDQIIELRLFGFLTTKEKENQRSLGPLVYGANRRDVVGQPPTMCAFFRISDEREARWLTLGHES